MSTNKKMEMELDSIVKQNPYERRRRGFRRGRRYNNFRSSRSDGQREDGRRRLIVENLNTSVQNAELNNLFKDFGKLTRCGIRFDKMGASRGVADIEFSTHEDAQKAIEKLNDAEIGGVKVTVKYAPNKGSRRSRFTRNSRFSRRNRLNTNTLTVRLASRRRGLRSNIRFPESRRPLRSGRRPLTDRKIRGSRRDERRPGGRRIVFKNSLGRRSTRRTQTGRR